MTKLFIDVLKEREQAAQEKLEPQRQAYQAKLALSLEADNQRRFQEDFVSYPKPKGLFRARCPNCGGKLEKKKTSKGAAYGCYDVFYKCYNPSCLYKYAYRHHTIECGCGYGSGM